MDRGAWQASVHGVAKSWIRLSDFTYFSLSCTGEESGNPFQCSCLENPRDGGAWWAAIYGVAPSWTWLKQLSSSSSIYIRPLKLETVFLLGCFQTRIIKISYPFRPKIGESYSYPLLRWGFPMHRVLHLWYKPTVHAATTWVPLSISYHGTGGQEKTDENMKFILSFMLLPLSQESQVFYYHLWNCGKINCEFALR